MVNKTLIILANSVKHRKHCVAGKDFLNGRWVRPISDMLGGELEESHCVCKFCSNQIRPLDIVSIDFEDYSPSLNQPENWKITGDRWIYVDRIKREDLNFCVDNPKNLWKCGDQSDRIPYDLIKSGKIRIMNSLCLIFVEKIKIYWKERLEQRPQRRGIFHYGGRNMIWR